MYFTKEKVKANAKMVRIGMPDELDEKMRGELEGVLDWIKGLDGVDASGVLPLASVSEHPLPRRPDTVSAKCAREELLSGAPDRSKDGASFAVPKIIE
jgi:aspartyl/glutamyl-tRNA(Asn/Gln) amidotransferase C subunit